MPLAHSGRTYGSCNARPIALASGAYDAMMMLAEALRRGGPDRKGVHDGLAALRDVPSVIFGKATFGRATRRVRGGTPAFLQVRNGAFVVWDGTKPH